MMRRATALFLVLVRAVRPELKGLVQAREQGNGHRIAPARRRSGRPPNPARDQSWYARAAGGAARRELAVVIGGTPPRNRRRAYTAALGDDGVANIGVDTANAFFEHAPARHFRTYPTSRQFVAARQEPSSLTMLNMRGSWSDLGVERHCASIHPPIIQS